jgi:hypothetical protein
VFRVGIGKAKIYEATKGYGMASARDYRRFADHCASLTTEARDEIERRILKQIEEQWRRLANYKAKAQSKDRGTNRPIQ